VYRVICPEENCGQTYIGETRRRLNERIKDHSKRDKASAILRPGLNTGHQPVNSDSFVILRDGLTSYKKRKMSEALFIKEQKPVLNEQGQSTPLVLLD